MIAWLEYLGKAISRQESCVLVTVAGTRGSTPREIGAKMVVTKNQTIGTIGGGQLEYQCTQIACDWLGGDSGKGRSRLERFPLGTNCGQCCGGVAEILFEEIGPAQSEWIKTLLTCHTLGHDAVMLTVRQSRHHVGKAILTGDKCYGDCDELTSNSGILLNARYALSDNAGARHTTFTRNDNLDVAAANLPVLIEPVRASDFHIAVFGAGHVGSACVDILSKLDAQIHLIDTRRSMIESCYASNYPGNVQVLHTHDPTSVIRYLPENCYYLIMTHDHAIDFELCTHLLRRSDIAYCGLIGSLSKRRRFEKRFRASGILDDEISRLTCPIGIEEIKGKKPYEIAIAATAQLLSIRQARKNTDLPQVEYGSVSRLQANTRDLLMTADTQTTVRKGLNGS